MAVDMDMEMEVGVEVEAHALVIHFGKPTGRGSRWRLSKSLFPTLENPEQEWHSHPLGLAFGQTRHLGQRKTDCPSAICTYAIDKVLSPSRSQVTCWT